MVFQFPVYPQIAFHVLVFIDTQHHFSCEKISIYPHFLYCDMWNNRALLLAMLRVGNNYDNSNTMAWLILDS